MATTEQLYDGLRNADAAGDTEAAQRFAGMIKEQGTQHNLSVFEDYNPQLGAAETAANLGTGVVAKVAGEVPKTKRSNKELFDLFIKGK